MGNLETKLADKASHKVTGVNGVWIFGTLLFLLIDTT